MGIWQTALQSVSPATGGQGGLTQDQLAEMMQYFQSYGLGGNFSVPGVNSGGQFLSPIGVQTQGEDGTGSTLQGFTGFDSGNIASQMSKYGRIMPGTTGTLYGTDGGNAGSYTTQTDGPDGIQKLVLAGILAAAGGGAYSEMSGAGSATADAATTGGTDIFGGSGMATGFTDTGTAGLGGAGALDSYAGGAAVAGAGGAGPALGEGAVDLSGGSGVASSDAAFNSALQDAGLTQSTWQQLVQKLGLPAGMSSGTGGLQILSGLMSLYSGSKGQSLANKIMSQSDPFAAMRGYYGGQLMDLEKNPTSVSSRPDYKAGYDAVMRSMASQGYNGSGNMATSLMDYGQKYFSSERAQLAQLAGANATPGAGSVAAANLTGSSLATDTNGVAQIIKGLQNSGFDLSGLTGGGKP